MRKFAKMRLFLICGLLGCLCYGAGDWLMLYGDPAYRGTVAWLTEGAAVIPQWRYSLAMFLAFPGIVLYGTALFAVEGYITGEKEKKIYHWLNAFGMTPWIALHLFYVMILTLYAWMNGNGYGVQATKVCEGLFHALAWVVQAAEGMMLPVFVWWFYLQITGKTVFPKQYAFTNVLIVFAVLKGISLLLPVSAFRLGFTNGLMSESMAVMFGIMLAWECREV